MLPDELLLSGQRWNQYLRYSCTAGPLGEITDSSRPECHGGFGQDNSGVYWGNIVYDKQFYGWLIGAQVIVDHSDIVVYQRDVDAFSGAFAMWEHGVLRARTLYTRPVATWSGFEDQFDWFLGMSDRWPERRTAWPDLPYDDIALRGR